MAKLLFATHNPWKVRLFQPAFNRYGFDLVALEDLETLPALEENGISPVENALAKARLFHSKIHPWVFGDDAGLEIEALGGEPGLKARRWGGQFPDHVSDQAWLDYLLGRMSAVPVGQRSACFHSGWALIAPDGSEHTYEAYWPFEIAPHPIRPIQPGSPISAVRIGPPDDLQHRQMEIQAVIDRWGILGTLPSKFGD